MNPLRLLISSVQKEFAAERAALRDYLRGDALMRRFFEPFLFEDVPAADRRADEVYLYEVEHCDLYVGLFGDDYGFEDAAGLSPTEREFNHATKLGKLRLIFVKDADDKAKNPKMQALIGRAGSELIRRRFTDSANLLPAVYASLVEYIERMGTGTRDMIRRCRDAGLRELEFRVTDGFTLTIPRLPTAVSKTPEEGLGEKLGEKLGKTRAAIVKYMMNDPKVTVMKLAELLSMSTTAVEKNIQYLKSQGHVRRIGPAKGGHWEVLE